MSESTVAHAGFTVEQDYRADVATVFAAWSDPEHKAAWFAPAPATHALDFRVGGLERVTSPHPDGGEISFDGVYRDIVPLQRIVYTGELSGPNGLATLSITTIELDAADRGTRLVLTEQDTFLDGQELPEWRERGTRDWLKRLGAAVDGTAAEGVAS